MLTFALPGVVYVYYGDELGLPNVELPDEVLQDPTWERSEHTVRGRDACRIPMPWTAGEPPYGFSPEPVDTWLPQPAGWSPLAAESQVGVEGSTHTLYKDAIALRKSNDAFSGDMSWVEAPAGCLAFRRDGGLTCLVNFTNHPVALPPHREVLLTSVPLVDGKLPGDAAAWVVTG